MQFFRQEEAEISAIVGWGVRVLLLSACDQPQDSKVAVRIAGLGGAIEIETDAFAALETLVLDSTGYGLFVIEADAFGGLEAARKIVSMLHKGGVSMPILLVASDCKEQEFPNDSHNPVILRAPVSAVALRVGFEHAMRGRLVFQTA